MTPLTGDNDDPANRLSFKESLGLCRPDGSFSLNSTKSIALWTSTQYDFETARTERSVHLVDLKGDKRKVVLEGLQYTSTSWVDEKTFIYLRPPYTNENDAGLDHPKSRSDVEQSAFLKSDSLKGTAVWAFDIESQVTYQLTTLPVAIDNIKLAQTSPGSAVFFFSATVFADGDIWNVAEHEKRLTAEARGSDVKVYDGLFLRHWDEWKPTGGELTQLHYIHLSQNPSDLSVIDTSAAVSDDSYDHIQVETRWSADLDEVKKNPLGEARVKVTSPLAGTKFECPCGPFGSASDYSLSSTHLLFHTKDQHVNPAWHTRTQVYLLPLSPKSSLDSTPVQLTLGNQGACSNPSLSRDGRRAMWLEMAEDGYEADRNRVIVYEIGSARNLWAATSATWDRSPEEIQWKEDSSGAYLITQDRGHKKLFSLDLPVSPSSYTFPTPSLLGHRDTLSHVEELNSTTLVVAISSFTSPTSLFKLSLAESATSRLTPLAALTSDLVATKSLSTGTEFTFIGSNEVENHGFILFPPGYDAKSSTKYPLLFWVHGGPQSAWMSSWSNRWNPNLFTSHGYIVVLINPTGSTGYGQAFTDGIKNEWGGRPWQDLVAGLEYVEKTYPAIDSSKKVLCGASYGGFIANWAQGHNDHTKFCAIISHDGVFSTPGVFYNTDELYFPEREFGGLPWDQRDNYERWNPQNHIANWSTPQMVIHGGLDYRLCEVESIGVFNTLQRLGVPSRFVYFPNENHWVSKPVNSLRWHEEFLRFANEWTSET